MIQFPVSKWKNWNIVESGVKHYKPNQNGEHKICMLIVNLNENKPDPLASNGQYCLVLKIYFYISTTCRKDIVTLILFDLWYISHQW